MCHAVLSVVFPDSVTEIGFKKKRSCPRLKKFAAKIYFSSPNVLQF